MVNKHITIGIYNNKDFVHNIVLAEHLESHIQYNLEMRSGRIFYVDGKRINNGYITEDKLSDYDEIASTLYKIYSSKLAYIKPTIPYR